MKPIPGYEGLYSITEDGHVFSHGRRVDFIRKDTGNPSYITKPTKWLKLRLDKDGYQLVALAKNGKTNPNVPVHQLVLLTYGPPRPSDCHYPNHKNFNRADNHIDNLEWKTIAENNQFSRDHGRFPPQKRGSNSPRAKLTEQQVKEIRNQYVYGSRKFGTGGLAERYSVTSETIRSIVLGKSYREDQIPT